MTYSRTLPDSLPWYAHLIWLVWTSLALQSLKEQLSKAHEASVAQQQTLKQLQLRERLRKQRDDEYDEDDPTEDVVDARVAEVDERLIRTGNVLCEEADERAAVQQVDEPLSLRQLGHRVLAQRHVETCENDRTGADEVSGVCGAGIAAALAREAAQHAATAQRPRGRAA